MTTATTPKAMAAEALYQVEIVDYGLGKSAKAGTPEFAIQVSVTGIYDAVDITKVTPIAKTSRTIRLYFTDSNVEYALKKLRAIGFDGHSFAELDKSNQNHKSLVGNVFTARCSHREGQGQYAGKKQENWDVYIAMRKPVENNSNVALELDGLFGAALIATLPEPLAEAEQAAHEVQQNSAGSATQQAVSTGRPWQM